METAASPLSHPWTQAVQLSCVICGTQAQPGPSWTGCKTCQGPLVADYSAVEGQPDDLLPVPAARLVALGQGGTPLVRYGGRPATGGASAGREVRLAEQGPPSAGTGAPPP